MPSVGPQLPPSIAEKRKRSFDGENGEDVSSSRSNSPETSGPSPDVSSKRQRVIGPTLPPAPIDERPPFSPSKEEESKSESEDDYGPSLPSANKTSQSNATTTNTAPPTAQIDSTPSKRDEWMTLAPTGGDWSARVDPTKLKSRKFNTGKGAKGPPQSSGGGDSAWHENPEQRQARLQREIMGIKDNSTKSKSQNRQTQNNEHDHSTATRMKEHNKARGPSLYDTHQQGDSHEKDDDPSARAFDREKDIGGGLQINSTKRREMLKKASDFGSRFSSAKYL